MILTKDMFDELLITTDDCDSYKLYGLPFDEVVSIIYRVAKLHKTDFSCYWYYYNLEKDSDNPVAVIQFTWGIKKGFSASLLIEYNVFDAGHTYEISLFNIPMRLYNEVELYDLEAIFEQGIELFNANFNESKYNKGE